ncbi:MAG: hypothetical protein HYY10_03425 [Candidatus Liptonbacteria bacterium]|nr:hypothetical protein [Candidatus Liptonbacteria bacterium]
MLPVCHPTFSLWKGPPVGFSYGGKPILTYNGGPCFAELVILRLLHGHGWDGAWVETYGGTHYLRTMPHGWSLQPEHVLIPTDKEKLLQRIRKKVGTSACFDVFAWRGKQILFCEFKQAEKDRLNAPQRKFIAGALTCGIPLESLMVVEWKCV